MTATEKRQNIWRDIAVTLGVAITVLAGVRSIPAKAQQYLTPNGTAPESNTVPVAPPLNSSSSIQQKAGSLIIGQNGGSAKLCLNAGSTTDVSKCVQSWADVANSIGGPFLKYSPTLAPSSPLLPDSYPSDPGFVRVQAQCSLAGCPGGSQQLYSFLTTATTNAGNFAHGLYATDSNTAASSTTDFAGYFSGRLYIYNTIGNGDPPGQLCLNGDTAIDCIDQWTDISPPSTLFLRLQSANPPSPDTGSISITGTALLGSAVIDAPTSSTGTAATCGDGYCSTATENQTNCPIDCAPIVQLVGFSIPNVGGQYCSLNTSLACTASPDTCGASGPCVNMTGEIRVTTPSGQLPSGSQVSVIVVRAQGAAPTFVPLQGSTYTRGTVFGDSTIMYAGKLNQSLINSLVDRDVVSASGIYYYRAFVGNLYPRYGTVYMPSASDATVTYYKLTVTPSPAVGGIPTSTVPDSQIKCGASPNTFCTGFYRAGSVVVVAPQPNVGYTAAWTGCTLISAGNCSVTMNTDVTIAATYTFTSNYTLTVNKGGTSTGTVSSSPAGINCNSACGSASNTFFTGELVTLTATKKNIDDTVSWSGCTPISEFQCQVTMSANITVTLSINIYVPPGPPPTPGCFAAGTMVDTPNGPRAIESLRPGDPVYAFDEATGRTVISRVTRTYVHPRLSYGRLTLSDGTVLEVTANHRFYNPRARRWTEIGQFRPGDVVQKGHGRAARELTIWSAEFTSRVGTVYNLEIERYQNYYVEGVLVHNKKI